ncbi:hypothetical protein UZ36_05910, partial [Candidatus Nitromaritima sp. SCGC AAA799-C22]
CSFALFMLILPLPASPWKGEESFAPLLAKEGLGEVIVQIAYGGKPFFWCFGVSIMNREKIILMEGPCL